MDKAKTENEAGAGVPQKLDQSVSDGPGSGVGADAGADSVAAAAQDKSAQSLSAGAKTSAAAGAKSAADAGAETPPAPPPSPPPSPPPASPPSAPRRGLAFLAWCAFLLSLAALGLGGWLYYEGERRDERSAERYDSAARANRATEAGVRRLSSRLRRAENAMLEKLADERAEIERERRREIRELSAIVEHQGRQLLELGGADRSRWALAEAGHLVRLANQRLLMGGDADAALALLASADGLVEALGDSALLPVRAALAQDIADLRAAARPDAEGLWARLEALAAQSAGLRLYELPDGETAAASSSDSDGASPAAAQTNGATAGAAAEAASQAQAQAQDQTDSPVDDSAAAKLKRNLAAAAAKLAGYITIQRRSQAYQAPPSVREERLARRNLQLLLAQAQTAILLGSEAIYQDSLKAARRRLEESFSLEEPAAQAVLKELKSLQAEPVASEFPAIDRSRQAIQAALNRRGA